MANETKKSAPNEKEKKVNKTWEAFGKLKGAFTVIDPKFLLQDMRYLLDTNIFIYAAIDRDSLSKDVSAILEDYDNTFFLSSESVKEMIVGFNNGGIVSRFWSTAAEMVDAIREQFYIRILPVGEEQLDTYARLEINMAEEHKDPSDHIIIAHAITNRMPLISSDHKFKFYTNQGLDLIFNKK